MNMKYFLLSIILLFSFSCLNAQGLKFGIKVGADMNKLAAKGFDEGFTFGYHAGGFAEIKLSKKFSFQPEVYFRQQNMDTAAGFSDLSPTIQKVSGISLKYLNIPLILNLKMSKGIAIQVGPKYSILMSGGDILQNGQDAFKKGDLSMLGGLQISVGGFIFYGRYEVGLQNISDVTNSEKWTNQAIHLGLGLSFL